MNLTNIRDKYRQRIKFFESKDLLNESHVKVFIKGLSGMKTFIVDNNEMFEPLAIEWLDVYSACRLKFDENLFLASIFYTTATIIEILIMGNTSKSFVNDFADSYFRILLHVSEQVSAKIFIYRLPIFKMLSTKIFNCGVYSHQVTFLEILFRFFNDYRNCQYEEERQHTPTLISNELFPDIKNKDELIQLFLNMNESSYDTDSRRFLNKLNRCVEPCKIFSIVAESIKINENKLMAPMLTNQSYKFWVDFNINLLEMSFPCKGEEDQNGWVTNNITKEDLEQLISRRNATQLNLTVYLKMNSNLSSIIMTKFINSNLTKIDFKFVLSDETTYLIKSVLPYYYSYLQLNIKNVVMPAKDQITNTILGEQDNEEQQIRAQIIRYATTMNSFTFEQSFSKSSTCTSIPLNFNVLKELIPKPIFQKETKHIESAKTEIKPVLTNITNNINRVSSKVVKSQSKCKKNSVSNVGKKKSTDYSDFDKLKSNGKPVSITKRKLYTKQVLEVGLKGSQSSKENIKQSKKNKPRKTRKLVNRVVPLQKDTLKKKTIFNKSEILQIQANVEIINSGMQNSEETVASEVVENETSNENYLAPLSGIVVYDVTNIHRVELKDEEFVSNVISQVRSQRALSQTGHQTPNMTVSTKSDLIPVSTPFGKIQNTNDNKNISNSYRRFAKLKNSTTKLGYNSNIDFIEPYPDLQESAQPPLRVQGFRQSKAKIKNFCETDSTDEEVSAQVEHLVVADVHSPNLNNTFVIEDKETRLNNREHYNQIAKTHLSITDNAFVNPSGNQCNELTQIANIASNCKGTSSKENSSSKLSNRAYNKLPIKTINVGNEVPNITITIDKQSERQRKTTKHIILNTKPVESKTFVVVNEKPNTAFVTQTVKPSEKPQPVISIPMPILLNEINTEYIISVDDDSGNENMDRNPEPQGNLEKNNFYSMFIQGGSNLIQQPSERSSKRKCSDTGKEAEKSSETNKKPKQKRTLIDHDFNAIVPMNTIPNNNNTILNNIKKKLFEKPKNLDCNKRFSYHNELIRCSNDREFSINCEKRIKNMRHTISCATNIAENCDRQGQLQNLIDMFNHKLKNEAHVKEIQAELLNIKKARLDKEQSLSLIVEEKKQKLCNKNIKIIQLLGSIKEQEKEVKAANTNLFKKIEKLTQSINKNRAEISLQENEINQIKKAESNFAQRLIETINDQSENIRDTIWRQFIIDLGQNIQQHFFDRYL